MPPKQQKPIVHFVNRNIYKITPKLRSQTPFIIQWIGPDRTIDFNDKEEIVGMTTIIKYQFISDYHCHGNPILGNNYNTTISLNNIKAVEETNLVIGQTYTVGDRKLVLRGFVNDKFYVSENPYTNDYETYHNVPVDEKKQIFTLPMTDL